MKIGLVDVDGHRFPSLPLMKISAWHKQQGDVVEWASPLFGEYDRLYMSKVFSFTPDDLAMYKAREVIRGGTGYAIRLAGGREVYDRSLDRQLPPEVEHIYPDYSLYPSLTADTAYGFLSRGCPRRCSFCHVAEKEGRKAYKVADLSEFWRGQKNIVLCDPNILACRQWEDLLGQLADSRAWIDLNQGVDVRLLVLSKANWLTEVEIKRTWSDFMADFKKTHTHDDPKLSHFYYAVPISIAERVFNWLYTGKYKCDPPWIYYEHSTIDGYTEHNPHKCGLIIYASPEEVGVSGSRIGGCCINVPAHRMYDYKVSTEEELKLLRLLGLRIWNMKKKLAEHQIDPQLF